jgi:hypothetical protein
MRNMNGVIVAFHTFIVMQGLYIEEKSVCGSQLKWFLAPTELSSKLTEKNQKSSDPERDVQLKESTS